MAQDYHISIDRSGIRFLKTGITDENSFCIPVLKDSADLVCTLRIGYNCVAKRKNEQYNFFHNTTVLLFYLFLLIILKILTNRLEILSANRGGAAKST